MTLGRVTLVVCAASVLVGCFIPPFTLGAAPRPSRPETRRVVAPDLPVRIEPDDQAYETGRLRLGTEVVVRAVRDDWAEIDAPAETFLWVDADGVRTHPDGPSVAIARRARLRYALPGATEVGPPHPLGVLAAGAVVRQVDQPELRTGPQTKPTTWWAIAPPEGETRFVSLDGLEPPEDREGRRPEHNRAAPVDDAVSHAVAATAPASDHRRPERLTALEPPAESDPADLAKVPPEVAAELTAIAAEVRAVQARPVESWNLEPIRGRYEALLRRFGSDPTVRSAVQTRQAVLESAATASRAAKDLDRLLQAGDRLDATVADARQRLKVAQNRSERGFDATGFLQASSRRYQGQKVLALIGPEGNPVGYVQIPPGVPVSHYMAHRVGVRGVVHYDQGLGARLISARDLEILDRRR